MTDEPQGEDEAADALMRADDESGALKPRIGALRNETPETKQKIKALVDKALEDDRRIMEKIKAEQAPQGEAAELRGRLLDAKAGIVERGPSEKIMLRMDLVDASCVYLSKAATLEAELAAANEKIGYITALADDYKELEIERDDALKMFVAKRELLIAREGEREELMHRLAAAHEHHGDLENERDEVQAENEQLRADIARLEAMRADFLKQNDKRRAENERLRAEETSWKTAATDNKRAFLKEQKRADAAERERDEWKERAEEAEDKLSTPYWLRDE